MKAFYLSLILTCSVFASESIIAAKVDGSLKGITPSSKMWDRAIFDYQTLYPQTTIGFNDINAKEKNSNNGAKKVVVGALYNDKELAIKIRWFDATKDTQNREDTDGYADGFALQFAKDFSNAKGLPYIGMGDKNRKVIVHLTKSTEGIDAPNANGDVEVQQLPSNMNLYGEDLEKFTSKKASARVDYSKSFIAQGFRTTTMIDDVKFSSVMEYNKEEQSWSATISRSLKDSYLDLSSGAIPIAFAIWDGSRDNRDGLKHISGWIPLKKVSKTDKKNLAEMLSKEVSGDIENGKKVALDNCSLCHNYGDVNNAPEFMAPNLSNIGGYSTADYLAESILKPDAVIVPGYNRNAHKNFSWYNIDEGGNRISTMPSYDWLDEKSRDDLIAFLQTLKNQ